MAIGTPFLVALLLAAVVFVIYLSFDIHFGKKQKIEALKHRTDVSDDYYTPEGGDALLSVEDEPSGFTKGFESLFRMFGTNVDASKRAMRSDLGRAGIASPDAPILILFYKRVLGPVIGVVAIFIGYRAYVTSGPDDTLNLWLYMIVCGLFAIFGLFGAQLYLSNRVSKRKKLLTKSFPDTLDLMVVCVESGLALDAALSRVTSELGRAYPEITSELNRTRLELALLNDRSRALINLAERTDLIAFRSLVAALIQTEKFGTSLTDTLRVLSDDYRHTRLMIAENKANRLPALMTIPLICLLIPALFIIILAPAFIMIGQVFNR